MLQQRKILETVSGALTNTRLEVKIEDLIIKVFWASPLTKSDRFAIYLHAVDPPNQNVKRTYFKALLFLLTNPVSKGYGASSQTAETQQEGEVWFSTMFAPDEYIIKDKIRKHPLMNAPSGAYYVSLEVNDKEMAKSAQFVVDFTGKLDLERHNS